MFRFSEIPASGYSNSLRALKYLNSRVCSFSPSSMKSAAAAKPVAGWRFAPACCAAQPVSQARRRSAVLRSAPSQLRLAIEALHKIAVQVRLHLSARVDNQGNRIASNTKPKKVARIFPTLQGESFMPAKSVLSLQPVLANPALNRTYCGGPAFGLKKPNPNSSPPQ